MTQQDNKGNRKEGSKPDTAAPGATGIMSANKAKELLKKKGWSYRKAAPVLGVCYQHLSDVLNGQRESRRILNAIQELPEAPHARN